MRMTLVLALVLVVGAGAVRAQGHPRIFFRGTPPKLPWSERLADLDETPPGLALRWAWSGDEKHARAGRDELLRMSGDDGYGLSASGPVLYLPVTYDWLYAWKGWTQAQRRQVEDNIAKTAESCREFLDGASDHVWHTSAPRAVMGLGLAGIALEGHRPEAAEWIGAAREYLEKTYLPALVHLDGAVVAGPSYGVHEGFFPLGILLQALKSAKGLDYFGKEKRLGRLLEYMVQSVLPDQTFVRWGDIVGGGRASTRDEVRPVVDLFAAGCNSADGFALSARIARRWSSFGYHAEVLWLAPFFARERAEDAIRLPAVALFGRDSVGQACFRSGWGDDDTVVFFKCGDYFDDHGHFDQGSFTIFRRAPLAVRSFAYGDFGAAHRMEFGRHSIAHSTLVFGVDDRAGGQRVVRSMDVQDLADYRRKKGSKDLETGDVVGWETGPDHTWLAADLTAAYETSVVKGATRELVWLGGRWLLVLDRTASSLPARWVLHAAAQPKVEGPVVTIEGGASRLVCVTLLPEKPRIELVEGWKTGGKDYPPGDIGEFHVPGGHRVEVTGGTVFLHLLSAVDADEAPPRPTLVAGGEPTVRVAGYTVAFRRGAPAKVQRGR